MTSSALKLLFAAAMLTGVAACDDTEPRTVQIYIPPMGSFNTLHGVAIDGGSVPVAVRDAPFKADAEASEQFARLLADQDSALRFHADTAATRDTARIRVLVLHDTPGNYTGTSACADEPFSPKIEGEMVITAVVCEGRSRLVETRGYLPENPSEPEKIYDDLLAHIAPTLTAKEQRQAK
ncbi:hypothetical protein HH303_16260 [Rhodospirillaceae bacterium KN72]|uniref:Uncharacterized protein n=1 Tax=Pacificispira spongiicola TaxID=2729598 RepID=A0A7Y0E2J9_9PROT|nr:hypothetical protein [Pacificispira spongiicola]NMM46049.1 hypothetical protein [Pacificispira spongiicola]